MISRISLLFDSKWTTAIGVFGLSMSAYAICMVRMTSFFDTVSNYEAMKNLAHVMLHSLFFPALYTLQLYRFKSVMLCSLLAIPFYALLISNSIYYGYFQSMLQLEMIGQASVLPSVGWQIISQLITWRELSIALCCMGTIAIGHRYIKLARLAIEPTRDWMPALCRVLLMLLLVKGLVISARHSPMTVRKHDTIQLAKQYGLIGFYTTELVSMFAPRPTIPNFPGQLITVKADSRKTFGYSKPNIIFLQVESLDAKILSVEIDGQPLMKNLSRLAKECIYFPNFFAQHRGGASQDSELSGLFSILPTNGRSGFNSLRMEETVSLAEIVHDQGYYLAGFHANSGNFFNRERLFRKIGFDVFKDANDFHGEASGWMSKDVQFFEQSVAMLEDLPEPFFAYLITMQSHGPFKNYSEVSSSLDLTQFAPNQRDYLRSMYEVDLAIGRFIQLLHETGYLSRSILFMFADHSSQVDYDAPKYRYKTLNPLEHIPLFIVTPEATREVIEKTGSQLDLGPTVLHLLGLPKCESWLGTSLLEGTSGKVILNYPVPIVIENGDEGILYYEDRNQSRAAIEWSDALQGL